MAVRDGLAKGTTTTPLPLGERELQLSDAWGRAASYLSVGQIDC